MPFDTKRILQHFDTAHEVELDIFKRSSLSFQKCNPGLQEIQDCGSGQSCWAGTYPHFSAFNFPFVAVAFVSPPFCLEEMKNRREGEVLTTLGRREQIAGLLQLLLLLLWLRLLLNLLLLTLGLLLPRDLQRTEHLRLTVDAGVAMVVVVVDVRLMARSPFHL